MIGPEFCLRMAQCNHWMNEGLYALCAGLPDGALKEDRQAPVASIHGTLNHLVVGDRVWLGRFYDRRANLTRTGRPRRQLNSGPRVLISCLRLPV